MRHAKSVMLSQFSQRRIVIYRSVIAVLVIVTLAFGLPSLGSTNYNFSTIDVPTTGPTGSIGTELFGINNRGTIVGGSEVVTCFVYASSGMYSTCKVPFSNIGVGVHGINDKEDIVGAFTDSTGVLHGYSKRGDTYKRVEAPGSQRALPLGMNNRGQIVGSFLSPSGSATVSHGFIFTNGALKTLDLTPKDSPLFGLVDTVATGVNDSGHVVGYSQYLHGPASSGFLFVNGTITAIDVPGASETYAEGINNRDDIVGYFKTSATKDLRRGFLYRNGVFTLIDVPGAKATWAEGINDSGQIVGGYDDGQRHTGSWHGFLAKPSSGS